MIEKHFDGIQFSAGQWPLHPHKATIVMIHGSGNTNRFWKSQVTGLSDVINTVAVDLPGHGGSSGSGMNRVADYADAVEAFIDAINAPSPIVCGISLGGAIALQLLLDGKERYEAGVIVNSGARLKVLPAILEMVKTNYRQYIQSFALFAASEKTDPLLLKEVVLDVAKCSPAVVYNDFLACDAFDVMSQLDAIAAPVLVLTAADDKLTPAKYGNYLVDHISDASAAHIVDAGHLSPLERPDEVNQAIRTFLKQIG